MTSSTIHESHPRAVSDRIAKKLANGDVKIWLRNEEIMEQFLAMKLAVPSLSDEAAASLLVASALNSGVQIAGGR